MQSKKCSMGLCSGAVQGEMSTAQHLLVSYRGLHDAPPVLSYNHVAMAVARHEAASTDATNEGRSSGGSRQPAALLGEPDTCGSVPESVALL